MDSLVEKLEKLPIELLPEKSQYSIEELREIIPEYPIVVCDFYIDEIEKGEELSTGYKVGDVTNIDHHAPGEHMAKRISSANLAIKYVEENGTVVPPIHVVVNHADCDSVLSSSIMRGILPLDARFGDAAIAADHTGAPNEIADLLQALQEKRDLSFSLRNLEKLLGNQKIEDEAQQLLEKRLNDRNRVKEIIESGKFENIDSVYFTSVQDKFDAGMLPALLPEAEVIIVGSPMKDNPNLWEIKVRLGTKAKDGLALNTLNLPHFGGRWNAGSTKRSGGTILTPAEYAKHISEILKQR